MGSSTGVRSASSAVWTRRLRKRRSSSGLRSGSPTTLVMALPLTIRFDPTDRASASSALIWTIGIPSVSSSLASAAPPRLHDPQVEVRITPSTPANLSSRPISWAKRRMVGMTEVLPVVVKNSG